VICKIPPNVTSLPEGVARDATLTTPQGALQGVNSWGSDNIGYRGPAPPPGHGVHHYYFKLYALDAELNVESRLTKTRLLAAMEGHVLAQAELVGTYQR
jgi:Raf kinase inhibitor-like YbhB/YbcL family protein